MKDNIRVNIFPTLQVMARSDEKSDLDDNSA